MNDPTRWAAPSATTPVRARVTVPGSKSMTNRALVLAALADRPSAIVNPLEARDTFLMRRALTALGATVEDQPAATGTPVESAAAEGVAGPDVAAGAEQTAAGQDKPAPAPPSWHVVPGQPPRGTSVDVGNAGTVMRFAPPVAALTAVSVAFHGDTRAAARPVGPMLAALRELGAVIDDGDRGGFPFTVHGAGSLAGGVVTVDASASSQLISGLLLSAPRFDKGVEVRQQGPRPPSAPHIAMTVQMLREAGAVVESWTRSGETGGQETPERRPDTWRVQPGAIGFGEVIVQPDVSNAVPFLAAALVTGGAVTISGWPAATSQPASQIIGLLTDMGAGCQLARNGLTVTGAGVIHGIDASLADASESALVVAAAAAGALGEFERVAHGVHADLAARLALLVVDVGLRLLGQRPFEVQHHRLGHQHGQVGVRADRHLVAAVAFAAGALGGGTVAQPGLRQRQGQLVLSKSGRPVQQPGVPALGQQLPQLRSDPGGRHRSKPRARTPASTSRQTASRL
ncbi:MAG TPA: hypothetical protein VIV12_00945, partial [Streptosporangiaceae bacterium]